MYIALPLLFLQSQFEFRSFAQTPPLGWNSWDCYGTTITEEQFKANATVLQRELLPFGYNIATVDIQWYEPNAKGFDYRPGAKLELDEFGRLQPAPNRFPSSAQGKGFGPLAAWTHSLGLKFGIHLMRGIPRQAVEKNLPVFGTKHFAQDIVDRKSTCPWNPDMFGVDVSKPGGQEYYNSVFRQIAEWGVDFVKVDDLSRPYAANRSEIEAIRRAIDQSGRKMILSMSPGETPVEEHTHAAAHANMWRISDDFWDSWPALKSQFTRLKNWSAYQIQGAWPDADMLPLGTLAHGTRKTNFTRDEQRTLMTLWGIARSPLIIGADLTKLDPETLALLKQPDVLALNQRAGDQKWVSDDQGMVTWTSSGSKSAKRYVAVFNTKDHNILESAERLVSVGPISRAKTAAEIRVSVKGFKEIALVTTDNGDGIVFDHSVWLNPNIKQRNGQSTSLAAQKWISAKVGYGGASTTLDPEGRSLLVGGHGPDRAISAHAPSILRFKLPGDAEEFSALCTLTDRALRERTGATVKFEVWGFRSATTAQPAGVRYLLPRAKLGISPRAKVRKVWSDQGEIIPWHGCQLFVVEP